MNTCIECGKEIIDSEAAAYCSEKCYTKDKKRDLKESLRYGISDLNYSLCRIQEDIKDLIQDIKEALE